MLALARSSTSRLFLHNVGQLNPRWCRLECGGLPRECGGLSRLECCTVVCPDNSGGVSNPSLTPGAFPEDAQLPSILEPWTKNKFWANHHTLTIWANHHKKSTHFNNLIRYLASYPKIQNPAFRRS